MAVRRVLLTVVSLLRFAVNTALYLGAAGFAALFALEFVKVPGIANVPAVVMLERLLSPSVRTVSTWFGWHWPHSGSGANYAPWILFAAALLGRAVIESVLLRIDFAIRRMLKKPARVAPESSAAQVQQVQLTAESEQQRAALLKRYRQIEDALKSSTRKTCSFLSIDVVGSTKMKVGERKTAIDATFQAYEELVRETFEAYGVWKETWTPDGVMACFLDRELALSAAQRILSALDRFNRSENQLRTPIKIRCGLNEGDVAIFEDSALEKVADHSIDIAGHMQKYADEDALQLSGDLMHKLQSADGFEPTNRDVDGFATFQWRPLVAADVDESKTVA
jgi:class 3 adenylate cyclase